LENFFKEPQLVGLIEKALAKNNDVSVAVLTIRQLDLNYQQAKLGLYPNLDFSLGANRTWLSKNSLNGSLSEQFLGTAYMDDYSATVRLSWEADIWGKAKNHKESALAEYFMQKENLSALKTRLIAQVAQAYFNLLTLDEQLAVAQKNCVVRYHLDHDSFTIQVWTNLLLGCRTSRSAEKDRRIIDSSGKTGDCSTRKCP
jgi:outer membrane protein TolC